MALVKEKSFYKSVLMVAVPIVLQSLVNVGINMTDVIMLGKLGETNISGASLANQVFFLLNLFIFGLGSGAGVLASQYWGKKDTSSIRKILGNTYKFAIIGGLLFSLAGIFAPNFILSIYTKDAQVIAMGSDYLRIIAFSYLPFSITLCYCMLLRSVEKTRLPLYLSIQSLLLNTFLCYILIFGKLGMPALGIKGAAIATLIARVVECIVVLIYMNGFEKTLRFRIKDIFSYDKVLMGDYLKIGLVVLFNEMLWSLATSAQAIIIGRISTDMVAAMSIVSVAIQLCTISLWGLASASSIYIGKAAGTGNKKLVKDYAASFLLLATVIALIAMIIMLLIRHIAVDYYNVSQTIKDMAFNMMTVAAFICLAFPFSGVCLIGILRGAGDTKFVFWTDITFLWLISAPLGILAGWVLKLPAHIVYMCLKIDEPIKSVIGLLRLRGDKWIKDVTRDNIDVTEIQIEEQRLV